MFSAKLDLMSESNAFGELVSKARVRLNLSQRELAHKIKKSSTYVNYVERGFNPSAKDGKFQASKDAVDAIAKVLNIPIDEARLAAGYAPKAPITDVPKPIIEALAREGTLAPDDEILIADFITRLKRDK